MGDQAHGRYKAFLWVGIAYCLVAVLAPLALLWIGGSTWHMPAKGIWWSLMAGIVGSVGAFCVLLAFGALLLLWLIDWSASFAGPTMAKILHSVSITGHLQGFQRGVVDTKDVVFYLSFTFFTLFVTSRVVESRRWRR